MLNRVSTLYASRRGTTGARPGHFALEHLRGVVGLVDKLTLLHCVGVELVDLGLRCMHTTEASGSEIGTGMDGAEAPREQNEAESRRKAGEVDQGKGDGAGLEVPKGSLGAVDLGDDVGLLLGGTEEHLRLAEHLFLELLELFVDGVQVFFFLASQGLDLWGGARARERAKGVCETMKEPWHPLGNRARKRSRR